MQIIPSRPIAAQAESVPQFMISGDSSGYQFQVLNFGNLSEEQQQRISRLLEEHFAASPYTHEDILEFNVLFQLPVHVGQYSRRVEMLIFRLRSQISPYLRFRQSFLYN